MVDRNEVEARGVTCEHLQQEGTLEAMHEACCTALDRFAAANESITCPICIATSFAGALGRNVANTPISTDHKFQLLQTLIHALFSGYNSMATDAYFELQKVDVKEYGVQKQ